VSVKNLKYISVLKPEKRRRHCQGDIVKCCGSAA
jgi:hypothetical protein